MEITVKVPDEIAEQAKARGMLVEAHVEDTLAQRAAAQPSAEHPSTPAQIRAWLDSLAQFSDKIPPLPEPSPANESIRITTKWRLLGAWSIPIFSFA